MFFHGVTPRRAGARIVAKPCKDFSRLLNHETAKCVCSQTTNLKLITRKITLTEPKSTSTVHFTMNWINLGPPYSLFNKGFRLFCSKKKITTIIFTSQRFRLCSLKDMVSYRPSSLWSGTSRFSTEHIIALEFIRVWLGKGCRLVWGN